MCTLAALSGCASQGPLKPPTLRLPAPVRGLTVERVGNAVDLHWTTPSKTTDGVGLAGKHGAGQLTAEICRTEETVIATAPCASTGRVAVTAGAPADFHDVLPAPLLSGALRPLHYRVRVLNGMGRGARYVLADTLAGTAPPAVHGLAAAPVADGVTLRWQPDTAAAGTRTVLRVERSSAAAAVSSQPKNDVLAVEPAAHDPGGAVDPGAKPGIQQQYTVVRTRSVPFGTKVLTASSLPATITVSATAKAPPPPPPTGLETLVNTLTTPEIDLVWQPVEAATGYLLFRAEGDGEPVQLAPQPAPGLSYVDTAVHTGARYHYSVASVGASGIPGPRSAEVIQAIPQP